MKNKPKKPERSSGPKDRSLEAYKEWMRDLNRRLTTKKDEIDYSEKEWIEVWREYWKHQSER